jgi:transcriptional regulator with XRE-family HTH domain
MSEFSFREGALTRELSRRGLSQAEFAERAGLSRNTITQAVQGKRLRPDTFGKILIALGAIPEPAVPAGLARRTA